MRLLLPILLAATACSLFAEDPAMISRSFERWKEGAGVPFQNKAFTDSGAFKAGQYNAGAFQGVKSAPTKDFATKSFLGVKNPWFGKTVYETGSSTFAQRSDKDAAKKMATNDFEVNSYDRSNKTSPLEEERVLEVVEKKTAVVEPKAQGGVDQFTQNLSKDLSIDDIRSLLNKGNDR